MPDSTISSLPAATPLTPADLVPVVQGGVTKAFSIQQLIAANGAASLQVPDYASVRAITSNITSVYVTGYLGSTSPSGIAGIFVRDDTDTTSTDNGGTILVSTNGKRWKRSFSGIVQASWFGASPSATGAANATAFQAAFTAFGGANMGYGMASVSLQIEGTYNFTGNLTLPVNVSLVSFSGATLVSTSQLIWQNPSIIGGPYTYTQYWPYMRSYNYGINFSCPVVINCFIGAVFELCSFGDPAGNFIGLTLLNTNSLWTERTQLKSCFLKGGGSGADVIRIDAQAGMASPGTSSFAYTELQGCTVGVSSSAAMVNVVNGGTLYGGVLQVRGNATGTSKLFVTNTGSIKECTFDVRVEDDTGAGTPALFSLTGGQFWNNKGSVSLPSYNFSCSDGGGISYRDNDLVISGSSFQDFWGAGLTISNSTTYTTVANNSVVKRKPANLQSVDFFHSGAMTCAVNATTPSATQFLGMIPVNAKRILRVEITARVASSGNTGSKFYFDLRTGIGSGSFQYPLTLTSIFLTDGSQISNLSLDVDISSGSNWVLMAKPTDISPSGSNSGTPPTDVSIRIYFI